MAPGLPKPLPVNLLRDIVLLGLLLMDSHFYDFRCGRCSEF
jgi:hypothetical protein